MPPKRLHLPALRLPGSPFAPGKPTGRLFGIALVGTGILLLAVAAAPVLVGAQSVDSFGSSGPRDPGVRGGPNGAGGMLEGLSTTEQHFFTQSLATFEEVDDVSDGLGPRFNADSCATCHVQPDIGGSSPPTNPQFDRFTNLRNRRPDFITMDGPVREARFKKNPDGSRDGGVHALFTISGRSDTPPGCNLTQPDFSNRGNVIFRIPTPVFGSGMIEAITDSTILANKAQRADLKSRAGIGGHENRSGNDGTITRFGWKAQNKSLAIFAGEAYNVEQGVTNEMFPQEREENPACATNPLSEDGTHFDDTAVTGVLGDEIQFAIFMRFLAPPTPAPTTSSSAANGASLFNSVGCALCHTPTLQTGRSTVRSLNDQPANLYSDLLVHNMGSGLADGVSQGNAGDSEFRTAPLWGLGKRIFFLHDGRTKNLVDAIAAHSSSGSEANTVINGFNHLSVQQRQDILNFLRSL